LDFIAAPRLLAARHVARDKSVSRFWTDLLGYGKFGLTHLLPPVRHVPAALQPRRFAGGAAECLMDAYWNATSEKLLSLRLCN
jgi:hypothetical protein